MERPLNAWEARYGQQGFAWREGSVMFEMPEDYNWVMIEIHKDSHEEFQRKPRRAIRVPFSIKSSGEVAISNFGPGRAFKFKSGLYTLTFEVFDGVENETASDALCRLTFCESQSGEAQILVADSLMHPTYPLLMDAQPA